MKTNVRVIIDLVVEHEEHMPISKVKDIAIKDIHHSQTASGSVDYGHFRVIEIGRSTKITKETL